MPRTISNHAAAAKLIRAELKKNNIKATVRARSYAGGSSIDVTIKQDVLPATLREVEAFVGQFEYGTFDGMTDCYNVDNRRDDLPQVKFTFVSVDYSDTLRQAARDYIAEIRGIEEHRRGEYESLAIAGRWGDFWTSRKPRIRAAA